MKKPATIDEYIASFPEGTRHILEKVRQAIHEAAPAAKEAISYQMPTFKLGGNLVHFAAHREHIGFYPAPSAIKKFDKELKPYKCSKGAIRFPFDKPIPYGLINRIAAFRAEEASRALKAKHSTGNRH